MQPYSKHLHVEWVEYRGMYHEIAWTNTKPYNIIFSLTKPNKEIGDQYHNADYQQSLMSQVFILVSGSYPLIFKGVHISVPGNNQPIVQVWIVTGLLGYIFHCSVIIKEKYEKDQKHNKDEEWDSGYHYIYRGCLFHWSKHYLRSMSRKHNLLKSRSGM